MSGSNPESGWLIGSTHQTLSGGLGPSGEGDVLWADVPQIIKGGHWRPEELRTVVHPLGRVAVVGECLATDNELQAAAGRALETNDPAALSLLSGGYASIMIDRYGSHFVGDAASQYPLYIQPDNGGVRFSTHVKSFCRGSSAAPPDGLSLAIGVGMPWVGELQAGRTPVEGVMKTLPQEVIHVDNSGRITKTRNDSMAPSRRASLEDACEQLRTAIQEGAGRRAALGYKLSADFSGGYDSSSVAYFLARELDEPLTVVTQYSPDVPLDDLEYVRKYMALPESTGKFDHQIFERPAGTMMYRDLQDVEVGDTPEISIRDRGRYEDYFAFLRLLGSELHITGVGADGLVDMPPREYLGQLARPATLPRFIRAVFDVARTEKDSPRNVIADSRRLSRLEPKTRLLKLANILETPGTYDGALVASIFGAGTAPNWLTRPARKAVAEYAAEVANQARIPAGMDRANYRAYGELIMMGSSQYGMRQAAARYGLRPSAIFFDTAVLQACLSLPAHERMNPRVFKQLMGGAFAGIVPTEVTSRKTKGDYTKHVFQGMRGSQDFLRTIMNDSRLADLGIVDSVKVRASLESGFMGANMPLPSLDMLIASELWLRSLDNESWDQRTRYVAPPPPKTIGTEIAETEPLERQATFGMPDGIIAVTRGHDGGAVIVNMPAKRYQRIKPDAVQILRVLQERGSLAAAYDQLAEIYRAVPRDILERKAEACIRNMIEQGVLSEGISGYTLLHGAADQAIVPPSQVVPNIERTPDVRLRDYTAAFGGLVLGHILQRDPSFERQVRRLGAIRSRLAKQPATPQETTRLLAAARRISRIHLGRAACLELSMATALGAALRGRQAHVVLGVRSDPESFHAWPQAGDVPIRTNADEPIAGIYQPLITL